MHVQEGITKCTGLCCCVGDCPDMFSLLLWLVVVFCSIISLSKILCLDFYFTKCLLISTSNYPWSSQMLSFINYWEPVIYQVAPYLKMLVMGFFTSIPNFMHLSLSVQFIGDTTFLFRRKTDGILRTERLKWN